MSRIEHAFDVAGVSSTEGPSTETNLNRQGLLMSDGTNRYVLTISTSNCALAHRLEASLLMEAKRNEATLSDCLSVSMLYPDGSSTSNAGQALLGLIADGSVIEDLEDHAAYADGEVDVSGRMAISTTEAAARLGLGARTLAEMRFRGTGPEWKRVGSRIVYPVVAIEKWLSETERAVA
jgi:hypothetical protein